jgi:outer membrane lipoprotein-sorting protein
MLTKRLLGSFAVCGIATLAVPMGSDSALLTQFASAIHDAKSLKTTYIVQEIGGVRNEYTVDLKKPNMLRFDSPTQLIVADGKDVTTFDRAAKTYYKQPETPELLRGLFATEPYKTWGGFFDPNAYQSVAEKDLGTTSKGGKDYDAVEAQIDRLGAKTVTYYLDPSDMIARQVEFKAQHGPDSSTLILRTRSLDLNSAGDDSLYTFAPPDGTTEVSLADILAGKWYPSLDEAEKVASVTHKKIFIDFMASWCGPCKMLQSQVLDTDKFKKVAAQKNLVLCRIDTDLNPDLMTRYEITAIPVQAVVDDQGGLISKTVGYGTPDMFYTWLSSAAS